MTDVVRDITTVVVCTFLVVFTHLVSEIGLRVYIILISITGLRSVNHDVMQLNIAMGQLQPETGDGHRTRLLRTFKAKFHYASYIVRS